MIIAACPEHLVYLRHSTNRYIYQILRGRLYDSNFIRKLKLKKATWLTQSHSIDAGLGHDPYCTF